MSMAGFLAITCVLLASSLGWGQQRRKVIIRTVPAPAAATCRPSLLIQSPQVDVLGITVVSGTSGATGKWHTPCACLGYGPHRHRSFGAVFPLVRRREARRCGNGASAKWLSRARGMTAGGMNLRRPTTAREGLTGLRRGRRSFSHSHRAPVPAPGHVSRAAHDQSRARYFIAPQFRNWRGTVFMGEAWAEPTIEFVNTPATNSISGLIPRRQIVLRAPWKKIVCIRPTFPLRRASRPP